MLAIIGASGKLGGSTLKALLEEKLVEPKEIVALTSSKPGSETWSKLSATGVNVRHASFEDRDSLEAALQGVDKFFLVSTPQVELDYNDAPHGSGREGAHFNAIEAARAARVKHIYYSSLAFGSPSKAGVMRAHLRTEEYLAKLPDIRYTVIREGIYSESWPLYLGYYDLGGGEDRSEIVIGGDGPISWTAIPDLGLGNAIVLASPSEEYAGKTFYLSAPENARSIAQITQLVSKETGVDIKVKAVSRREYEQHYISERQIPDDKQYYNQDKESQEPAVKWWSTTYDALRDGECDIKDETLAKLLSSRGQKAKPIEETLRKMF